MIWPVAFGFVSDKTSGRLAGANTFANLNYQKWEPTLGNDVGEVIR